MIRLDADLLIAGGGLAAQRCCETLRRLGFDGRIVVLCEEPSAPYDRPPLSKSVLIDEREPEGLAFRPAAWYEEQDVELLLGVAAQELDLASSSVVLGDGRRLRFKDLLIATGSRPRRLPGVPTGGAVHELRTHEDALALRAALRERDGRLAILGAGLIGMEVAAAARALGREVTLIEAADTPLARVLPPALGSWIAYLHRLHGVDVRLATAVERVSLREGAARLELSDWNVLEAHTVLVAIGTSPATEWLAERRSRPGRHQRPTPAGAPPCRASTPRATRPASRTPTWSSRCRASTGRRPCARALPSRARSSGSRRRRRRRRCSGATSTVTASSSSVTARPTARSSSTVTPRAGGPFAAWIARAGRPQGALLVDRPQSLPEARARIAGAEGVPAGSGEESSDNHDHPKRGAPWPAYR